MVVESNDGVVGGRGVRMTGLRPSPLSPNSIMFQPVVSLPASTSANQSPTNALRVTPSKITIRPSDEKRLRASDEDQDRTVEDVQTSVDVVGVLIGSGDGRNESRMEVGSEVMGADGGEEASIGIGGVMGNHMIQKEEKDDWMVEGDDLRLVTSVSLNLLSISVPRTHTFPSDRSSSITSSRSAHLTGCYLFSDCSPILTSDHIIS